MSNKRYSPSLEGIDHINLTIESTTSLGRTLAEQAHTPFVHPEFGKFNSLLGYRHWLRTGKEKELLREYWGSQARLIGGKYKTVEYARYELELKEGVLCKVSQTLGLADAVAKCELPFVCYFKVGTSFRLIRTNDVLVKTLNKLRNHGG